MDRTQSRLIVAMAAVLAVMSLVLWQQGSPELEVDIEATEPIWEVELEDIEAVAVTRESGRLRLQRDEGEWRVVEPFEARADDDAVHELLDDLREIRRGIPLTVEADRAAEFGLSDPPHARVELVLREGQTAALDVGIPAPAGYRTYARAPSGAVVALNGDPNRSLQLEASRYRDHRVFRFDPAGVRRVRIAGRDGVLDVSGEGVDWWLEGFTRADPDRVDDVVTGLLELRFDAVLDLTQHIEAPTWQVDIELVDGQTHTLKVGDQTPMGVLTEVSDGRIGVVFPELIEQLGRGPTDVGVTTAFGIRVQESDTVTLSTPGRSLTATRNGPTWGAEGLDAGDVRTAVDALAEVPIRYLGEPAPDPGELWGRVEVQDGQRARRVKIGATVVDGFRIALDEDGGAPFRIPADALDQALQKVPDAP